ncbi:uncharacterized protein LOC119321951 [Triticum dicoccoides]|uniref:uncharacterized protein LOC119321951 n=1 Tax=Triticum dicoccoides TaxID=85692 RepID=UPI00188E3F95|nr:uncharacterized protein LOC119321951 [Triticum dicoccoides]
MMGSSSSWSVPPASRECSLQNGERYEITKALLKCKMAEGSSVSQHLVKLVGYMWRLEALGSPIPAWLCTDLILLSLPSSFNGFITNYMMWEMEKSVNELLRMLKTFEYWMQKHTNYVTKKTTSFKKKCKVKNGKGVIKTDTKGNLNAALLKRLSASFARTMVIGKGIAKSFWQKRRSLKSPAQGLPRTLGLVKNEVLFRVETVLKLPLKPSASCPTSTSIIRTPSVPKTLY